MKQEEMISISSEEYGRLIKKANKDGIKDGLERYAWWKDGVQYVGTCGTTLKKALEEVDKE